MIPSFIGPLVAALLFFLLGRLALRARKSWIRWPALVLSGLIALACVEVALLTARGHTILSTAVPNAAPDWKVAGTSEQIARGQKLSVACAQCHSTTGDLPLDGGTVNLFGGGPMGSLYAPNLTPAGGLADWSDGQIVRALREGVDDQNLSLVIMPSMFYHVLSDEDAQAVVAYLRSQPTVEHEVPERGLAWMAEALVGAGAIQTSVQPAIIAPQSAPPPGPTAEYGQYLVNVFACGSCHSPSLAGKKPGQGPAGSNLTQLIPPMQQAVFIKLMRNGKEQVSGMPYQKISSVTSDEDLTAIYQYLHALKPLPMK